MLTLNPQPQSAIANRQNQRGVAIIVAVAITVAVTMITVALLGTVRRSSSIARAYKINDILQLALASAKAEAIYSTALNTMQSHFSNLGGDNFIYDVNRSDGDGWISSDVFANNYHPTTMGFFEKGATVSAFNRKMEFTATDSKRQMYSVKTRTFVIPLDAAFLVNYTQKFYKDGGKGAYDYPFPGLFDGEAALTKNVVPVYTDVYAGYDPKSITVGKFFQNEFALDDYIKGYTFTDNLAFDENYFKNAVKNIVTSGSGTAAEKIYDKLKTSIGDGHDFSLTDYTPGIEINKNNPYSVLVTDLVKFASESNTPAIGGRIDTARLLMNYPEYKSDADNARTSSLFENERIGDHYGPEEQYGKSQYDAALFNPKQDIFGAASSAMKERNRFDSFNQFGLTIVEHGLGRGGELPVFLSSVPYNTVQFVDEGIIDDTVTDAGKKPAKMPKKIPLNATTPKWLIAAAIGWQLFNSPAAKLRNDSQLQDGYVGGAIYRIDYTANEDLAFVFDHRRLLTGAVDSSFKPTATDDEGEFVFTPFSSHVNGETVANAGYGHYYAYSLAYTGALVGCRAFWKGWTPTDNMDMLAFAPGANNQFTSAYEANSASPFSKGDYAIDVRTKYFAGTGTYIRPSIDESMSVKEMGNDLTKRDVWNYGRMAIYGNTLRTHNELARIVDIVDCYKDAVQLGTIASGAEHDDPVFNGANPADYKTDGKWDPIKVIIGKIYTDPQIGYRSGVPAYRTALSKNPHEGTSIWAKQRGGSASGDPLILLGSTKGTSTGWSDLKRETVTTVATSGKFALNSSSQLAWYPRTSGGGATADRSIETYMEGTTDKSTGPETTRPGSPSEGWGKEYAKYAVDNFARDWDGQVMDARSESSSQSPPFYGWDPTFHFDYRFNLKNEVQFSDSYFNVTPGNYSLGYLLDGTSKASDSVGSGYSLYGQISDPRVMRFSGSSLQGADVKMNVIDGLYLREYADSLWYRDDLVHIPSTTRTFGTTGKRNLKGGPFIYCDSNKGPDDDLGLVTGRMTNGSEVIATDRRVVEIGAPPYRHSYGRGDMRIISVDIPDNDTGQSTVDAFDLPGYKIVGGNLRDETATAVAPAGTYTNVAGETIVVTGANGSVSGAGIPSGAVALDISRQGLLYRNDELKLTSLWRWNWGRWTQIQNTDAGTKTGVYTFVPDASEVGRRKIDRGAPWEPSEGVNASFVKTTTTVTGQEVHGWRAFRYVDTRGGVNRIFSAPAPAVDGNNGSGSFYPSSNTFVDNKLNITGDNKKATGTVIHQNGVYMVLKDANINGKVLAGGDESTTTPTVPSSGDPVVGTNLFACDRGSSGTGIANCVKVGKKLGSGYEATDDTDQDYYVGRFVKRIAKIHRWKPAAGAALPYYIEINPQAIKNAAIERVVIALFGYPDELSSLIKTDYLINPSVGSIRNTLTGSGDLGGETIFHWKSTDSFYRIIVSAGLINERKEEVVAHKLLQFVYRQNADGSGEIVDQHYLDAE